MRVLVSAASKHGATAELAEAIAVELRARGIEVDLLEPNEVGDLDAYDGFVLGSAVYAGHWLAQAKDLAHRVARHAFGMPVWMFSSGPLGAVPAPDPSEAVDVTHLVEATGARRHELFTGRLDKRVLGFAERAIVAAVHAPEGDFRDFHAARAFARGIARELSGHLVA
jgi:menaquinone-dependent protoporphyrinogen oxidase